MAITLPAFVHRHPRYTALLAFVLLCSTLLLFPFHGPERPYSGLSTLSSKFHPGVGLEEWVRREEIHYMDALAGRKWLIEQYGGDIHKIDQ